MSQELFAREIGMKRSGFLRLIRPGEHGMFTDNFRRLAEVVRTSPEELRNRIGSVGERRAALAVGIARVLERSDPVSGVSNASSVSGVSGIAEELMQVTQFHGVSAGPRQERLAVEQGKVKVPEGLCDFAVRVDGDSMTPDYPNNGIVLFEGVEGQQFIFGREYLIWFSNEECYFSRVYESDDDRDVLVLEKLNSDRERFPDRRVHRREIVRVALCVGLLIRKR